MRLQRLVGRARRSVLKDRQGFFERDQYEAVRRHLRPDLQVVAAIEYAFGWRAQSEVLPLELRQLDLEAGTLRLDAGQTKNDEGRLVYLTPELKALLGVQVARVHALSKKLGRIIIVSPADLQDVARRLALGFSHQ